MATTSAFGWETPDDTDLVKDGAAAIRTLGNSIDTSMSELKGGTTGQILSKTSNTDMDFTWVANDQGDITGITASSPLTGGGTSGAVTVGIQDASTSVKGAVQLSDSTASTSTTLAATANAVKTTYDLANSAYAPAFTNNYYAGKNKIINGDFSVWQRGTSGFSSPGYTADRWRYSAGNGGIGISQQTFTPGAAPVSGYEGKFFLRSVGSVASTSGTPTLEQRIEDVQTYAGQTVTVSFWAKSSASTLPSSIVLTQNFGSGGSTAVDTTVVSSPSYTTSWVRYSYTVAVPSISGKTVGTSSYLSLVFNFPLNQTWLSFDIWGVQVEAGSVATPFQTATGTIQGELAACQRYYQRWSNTGTTGICMGIGQNSTAGQSELRHIVQMRTSPTAIEYDAAVSATDHYSFTSTNTSLAFVGASPWATWFIINVASGIVAGRSLFVQTNSGFVGVSAEL
jgi:hypothetical protein